MILEQQIRNVHLRLLISLTTFYFISVSTSNKESTLHEHRGDLRKHPSSIQPVDINISDSQLQTIGNTFRERSNKIVKFQTQTLTQPNRPQRRSSGGRRRDFCRQTNRPGSHNPRITSKLSFPVSFLAPE